MAFNDALSDALSDAFSDALSDAFNDALRDALSDALRDEELSDVLSDVLSDEFNEPHELFNISMSGHRVRCLSRCVCGDESPLSWLSGDRPTWMPLLFR